MRPLRPRIALLALACTLAAPVAAQHAGHRATPAAAPAATGPHAGHGQGAMELHRVMEEGRSKPMPPMSGDVDTDFARMMSEHHRQGVRMAEVQLQHGRDPKLRAMAQRIRDQQQKEIQELAPHAK